MPTIRTDDGVTLHYEEAGSGTPMVFVHEYAGDHRAWEMQLRFFSRRYRCIAYAARGYPPSEVPADPAKYSQDRATDDIAAIITGLGLGQAHVVGLSMGGFATLHHKYIFYKYNKVESIHQVQDRIKSLSGP
jgi:pimeloyl-ACP methyl ester carboxylesterase